MDVRWNTTCNLSCNYCGENVQANGPRSKIYHFKSGARPYYEQVCDLFRTAPCNIREVALVGGEPLLLPENERYLDVYQMIVLLP
jgi:organic radical activating enzyme